MSPQSSIAHYKITSKLGEGGMGAVYRATDTKLNRDVAIKVLLLAFAEDAARMARFEREAQVLASLTPTSPPSTASSRTPSSWNWWKAPTVPDPSQSIPPSSTPARLPPRRLRQRERGYGR